MTMMTADDPDSSIPSQALDQGAQQRCPKCAAFQRHTLSFLDSTRGRTVSIYECRRCGERIWHD